MAPVEWTTEKQAEFLQSLLSDYLPHMVMKTYHKFWPEHKACCLDINGLLTPEQETAVGSAIKAHKKQLHTWYRWHTNASHRHCIEQKTTSVFKKALKPTHKHILSEAELFTHKYYETLIKPVINADKQSGTLLTSGEVLNATQNLSKKLLEEATPDVKAKIKVMYDLQKRKPQLMDDDDASNLKQVAAIKEAIDELPFTLGRVAELISHGSGFFLLHRPRSFQELGNFLFFMSFHCGSTGCLLPSRLPKGRECHAISISRFRQNSFSYITDEWNPFMHATKQGDPDKPEEEGADVTQISDHTGLKDANNSKLQDSCDGETSDNEEFGGEFSDGWLKGDSDTGQANKEFAYDYSGLKEVGKGSYDMFTQMNDASFRGDPRFFPDPLLLLVHSTGINTLLGPMIPAPLGTFGNELPIPQMGPGMLDPSTLHYLLPQFGTSNLSGNLILDPLITPSSGVNHVSGSLAPNTGLIPE
ncbi:hypothetical protein JVU11DRAFT_433 [Chiua virens]|nr:hypothetical protein JVU11DRAFT_433 [Chiua virens]